VSADDEPSTHPPSSPSLLPPSLDEVEVGSNHACVSVSVCVEPPRVEPRVYVAGWFDTSRH